MLIVITEPDFFDGEGDLINLLFKNGLLRLHLRKPSSTLGEYTSLLQQIDGQYHERIVLHDHLQLAAGHDVFGIHLNRRNDKIPAGFAGSVSRSLHTEGELSAVKNDYDYVTISPIFDSVSKQGYNSAFTHEKLLEMGHKGLIDGRVIALGGITGQNIGLLGQYGFGGAMVLGSLWKMKHDRDSFLAEYKSLSLKAPSSPCQGCGR